MVCSETIGCRTQLGYSAEGAEYFPADIGLDLSSSSASFCRGSRCDEFEVVFETKRGQLGEEDYKLFSFVSGDKDFSLFGVIFPGDKYFTADSSELGKLVGSCSKE